MRNPVTRLQARLALHSHPPTAPPIILHTPAHITSTPLLQDDARRLRWCLTLKDADWYECAAAAATDSGPGQTRAANDDSWNGSSVLPRLTGLRHHPPRETAGGCDSVVMQVGRDFYWGVAAATRGIERRCGHPTLFPSRTGGGVGKADENLAFMMRRWADTSLRPAMLPFLSSSSPPHPHLNYDALHAHLTHIEDLLSTSLPARTFAATADVNPDRRITLPAGPPGIPDETTTRTRWHGVCPGAPYPHAADIFLASTVLTLRTHVGGFRKAFGESYPLTSAWVTRVGEYLVPQTEAVDVTGLDCVNVLANNYTVGELGNTTPTASPSSSSSSSPATNHNDTRTITLATGESFTGTFVSSTPHDITLQLAVPTHHPSSTPPPPQSSDTAHCSITLPREDVVTHHAAVKKAFRYVE
ncbi:hypothetical protein DFJ77DRAFT_446839 [Powellomyces hirtus]|nr:hypothetical protein DFJ77DRAFT_446839 [Powellomyces hirtus]